MDFVQNLDSLSEMDNNIRRECCTTIIKIRNFSDEQIYHPIASTRFNALYHVRFNESTYPIFKDFPFYPDVYANGSIIDNKGHISVLFDSDHIDFQYYEFSCCVCVLDVAKNRRFSQSFSFIHDPPNFPPQTTRFGIDKYIARRTLLEESSELLPNDTLTLLVDIVVVRQIEIEYQSFNYSDYVKSCFKTEEKANGLEYYLCLDSPVMECLRTQSTYFERMENIPMSENEARYMNIPAEEYPAFILLSSLVIGTTSIAAESIYDIFQLFAVADKYDVPIVTGVCLLLFRAFMAFNPSADLLEVVEEFYEGSYYLREILKNLLNRNEIAEQYAENFIKQIQEKNRHWVQEWDWTCESVTKNSKSYLLFKQIPVRNSRVFVEAEFDFYH